MAHTYSVIFVHCVFSTKGRLPLIPEPEKLWSMLRTVASHGKMQPSRDRRHHQPCPYACGGAVNEDACRSDARRKANSSHRMHQRWPKFGWQDGYGAISVSPTAIKAVTQYIAHQRDTSQSNAVRGGIHCDVAAGRRAIRSGIRIGLRGRRYAAPNFLMARYPGFAPRAQGEVAASRLGRWRVPITEELG